MSALIDAVPAAVPALSAGAALAWAGLLMLLAAALAVTEFLVVSWGLLLVGAAISALAAIMLAFQSSPVAGWCFVAATPLLGFLVVRLGIGLMRRNRGAVISAEITADAGYRHATDGAGVGIGAIGELTTPATPSGRARFAGKAGPIELDVRVQGPVLGRGDRVVVLAIDGAALTVAAAPDTVSGLMTNQPH